MSQLSEELLRLIIQYKSIFIAIVVLTISN